MTVLVEGGRVLDDGALRVADILIEGNRIAALGPGIERPADADIVDASHRIILPGLINAHTHAHNMLSRGLARRWTLEDQLNHGPALLAGRSIEDQYTSAAIGAVEMLKTGCTTAYDLFMALPSPSEAGVEAVVRAYTDVGMRAVVAPAVSDIVFHRTIPDLMDLLPSELRRTVESFRLTPADELLRMTENAIRRWDGFAGGRIRTAVSPTIPGQCTDEFLDGCVRLARQYGVGLHTHLLESKVQAIHCIRRWGKSAVAHLADIGMLGPRFTGAHAVWLTADDIHLLASTGATVVHNPASNLRLGNGLAPVRELLDAGVTVGLGTDGSMSSDNQDMFESMRFAALVSRSRFPYDQESWLDGTDSWDMATGGSARVLGMGNDIGVIRSGAKADLVLMREDSVFLHPLNDTVNALVYAETGAGVDTVLVDGTVVLANGRATRADENALYARAQEGAARLRHENRDAWTIAAEIEPYLAAACRATAAAPYPVDRYT